MCSQVLATGNTIQTLLTTYQNPAHGLADPGWRYCEKFSPLPPPPIAKERLHESMVLPHVAELSFPWHTIGWGAVMATRGWLLALAVGGALALSGCGDPYERGLDGILYSEGEAKRIASRLEPEEAELFVRWAARMTTPDRFSGEGDPVTVRGALINQRRFEEVAQEKAAEEARIAAEEQAKADQLAAEQVEYEQELQRLEKTHGLISQLVKIEFLGWRFEPLFGRYGLEAAREWQFYFKITNDTNGELVGLRGPIYIADTFAQELGFIHARLETSIPPGESKEEVLRVRHDKRDPVHTAMRGTQTMRIQWFFESLALRDGRVVDASNIDEVLKAEADSNTAVPDAAP